MLLDTSFIVKAHNPAENKHREAKNWFKKLIIDRDRTKGTIYISDFVCDEVATRLLYGRKNVQLSAQEIAKLLEQIMSSCTVFWIKEDLFNEAKGLFAQSNKMSFTDCTTIVLYKKLQVPETEKYLAHFDNRHFNRTDITPLC